MEGIIGKKALTESGLSIHILIATAVFLNCMRAPCSDTSGHSEILILPEG
jgi:hypothetical protein